MRGRVVLARVVAEAELGEHLVGPRRLAGDRERGRPVADGPFAGELLDEVGAALDVRFELVPALGRDAPVVVAVAGEVVALGGDRPHEVGVALGRDAEDEERRLRSELVEQLEDRGRLPLERVAARVPVRVAQAAVDELVPVLEVEAEQELGHRGNSKIDAR